MNAAQKRIAAANRVSSSLFDRPTAHCDVHGTLRCGCPVEPGLSVERVREGLSLAAGEAQA